MQQPNNSISTKSHWKTKFRLQFLSFIVVLVVRQEQSLFQVPKASLLHNTCHSYHQHRLHQLPTQPTQYQLPTQYLPPTRYLPPTQRHPPTPQFTQHEGSSHKLDSSISTMEKLSDCVELMESNGGVETSSKCK